MSDHEHDRNTARDERSVGERPGINQNPLGPSFRDGPASTPASNKQMLMGLIPIAVIAVVALLIFVL